ncbi:tail Collar domain-containing protein [Terasakiella brassicae]|uniref:Tail Collar domain-containing protein n=1 Tax=Terasakiella brassicae TaxID=1634917 RepID=A0A917BSI1_9PROT|nr:tail fiber protein [Terasakiella brassicae]GGF55122.1 tail Collar domain-containing protein [Terasakiella brassicae]
MFSKNIIKPFGLAVAGLLASTHLTTAAYADCEPDPYIGSICMTAASFCPTQYFTLGPVQYVQISQQQALFSLLGDTYGGDLRTNFGLPATEGRVLRSEGSPPGLVAVDQGMIFGSTHVYMTESSMPTHTHTATYAPFGASGPGLQVSTEDGTKKIPAPGDYMAVSNLNGTQSKSFIAAGNADPTVNISGGYISDLPPEQPIEISDTGGDGAIPISPPQLGMRYCIAYDGIYPPRT